MDNQMIYSEITSCDQLEKMEGIENNDSMGIYKLLQQQQQQQKNFNNKMLVNFERLTKEVKHLSEFKRLKEVEQKASELMNSNVLSELMTIKAKNLELFADNKELKKSMKEVKEELEELKQFNMRLWSRDNENDRETVMNCRYENLGDYSNAFSCIATNLSSYDPQLNVKLNIEGQKVAQDEVIKLTIQYQKIIFMPINFGMTFNNLVTFQVTNCQLQSVERQNFANMEQLQFLTLAYNNLKTLPADVFDDLVNLKTLILSNNQIESLPNPIFSKLKNLKAVNLFNNKLRNIPDFLFVNNFNLEIMDITVNLLTDIPTKLLVPLVKLKQCFLSSTLKANNPADMKELKTKIYQQICSKCT
ncbi:unnamed protein product [Diamesa serratosioi]